ncbi:MAG: DNA repair protein RadC [Candidatus Azobacteroides sp.]|nr:DNA repair protein RadC [Candidatus Azobacteroides sp.]
MTGQTKLSVKKWSPEDRPREKLLSKGIYSLSNAELLAIIIGSGNQNESAVDLAQRILQEANNNINQLGKFSVKHLISRFKGIGEAKAVSIVAALELGKRRQSEDIQSREKIRNSRDIYDFFHPILGDLPHEEFWALFVNRSHQIIDKLKISQGGVSGTLVDVKLIYKEAIARLASGIILCHNHPSGVAIPSKNDDHITAKIREGIKLLDMTLIDHLIVCDGDFYSYSDQGRIG